MKCQVYLYANVMHLALLTSLELVELYIHHNGDLSQFITIAFKFIFENILRDTKGFPAREFTEQSKASSCMHFFAHITFFTVQSTKHHQVGLFKFIVRLLLFLYFNFFFLLQQSELTFPYLQKHLVIYPVDNILL